MYFFPHFSSRCCCRYYHFDNANCKRTQFKLNFVHSFKIKKKMNRLCFYTIWLVRRQHDGRISSSFNDIARDVSLEKRNPMWRCATIVPLIYFEDYRNTRSNESRSEQRKMYVANLWVLRICFLLFFMENLSIFFILVHTIKVHLKAKSGAYHSAY